MYAYADFHKKNYEAWDECVALAAAKGVLLKYGASYSLKAAVGDEGFGGW